MNKRLILAFGLSLLMMAAHPASAACFADYKAKMDDPLRLHYGVIEIPDDWCSEDAAAHVAERIAVGGWILLVVNSLFGPEGLEDRRANAGSYYLRY